MSANVTLGGRTYNGVSTIAIGAARFVESSEASLNKQTTQITQEYSEASTHNIPWFVASFFGYTTQNIPNGVYVAKATNNTGFENTAKIQYALDKFILAVAGSNKQVYMLRQQATSWIASPLKAANDVAVYLANGATVTAIKLPEANW